MKPENRQRLLDLLADRAGGSLLLEADERELDRLLALHPDVSRDSFDVAAAAIHLALMPAVSEPLPGALRARLHEAAGSFSAAPDPLAPGSRPTARTGSPIGRLGWAGWLVAASLTALLLLPQAGDTSPTYDEVLRAPDVLVASWSPTEDPAAGGVEGRVAWSDDLQTGFMLFEGLPANDPREGQYQLWIFDPERPADYPVDGGVFDSSGGSVRVPIDAKLVVNDPSLFAVTYERPGGVVVSTRERLIVTAAPD